MSDKPVGPIAHDDVELALQGDKPAVMQRNAVRLPHTGYPETVNLIGMLESKPTPRQHPKTKKNETPLLTALSLKLCCCCCSNATIVNWTLKEVWPHLLRHEINKMKQNPYHADKLGPYQLRVKAAHFKRAPVLHNMYVRSRAHIGAPIQFECSIDYQGKPEVELVLAPKHSPHIGEDIATGQVTKKLDKITHGLLKAGSSSLSKVANKVIPQVEIDVHTITVQARISVTLYMRSKLLSYHFTGHPHILLRWDADKIAVPAVLKKFVAHDALEVALGHIDKHNPQWVDYSAPQQKM